MPQIRSFVGFAVLASALVAVPTAQADTEVELHAHLHGGASYPRAYGDVEYERSGSEREIEVTLASLKPLARQKLVVKVNHKRVGTVTVTRSGYAHREWETHDGDAVPYASAGDPIRVRTIDGALVLRGRY